MTVGLLSFSPVFPGSTGKMVVNAGIGGFFYGYKNFAKSGNSGFGNSTEQWGAFVDKNMYPTQNPVGNLAFPVTIPANYAGNWAISFLGEGTFQIQTNPTVISDPNNVRISAGSTTTIQSNSSTIAKFTGSIAGTALTSGTITNAGTIAIGQPVIGVGVATGTIITGGSGTAWTVNISQTVASTLMISGQTRIVVSYSAGSQFSCNFPNNTLSNNFSNLGGSGASQYSSMQGLIVCRCSAPYGNGGLTKSGDEVDIESGDLSRMFNSDTIATIGSLKAKVLRFMGALGINGSNQSSATNVNAYENVCYTARHDPNIWVGTIGGTNGQYTCSNAPGSPGTLTEGEQINGTFTNAQQAQIVPSVVSVAAGTITFTVPSTATVTNGQWGFVNVPGVSDTKLISQSALDTGYILTVVDGVTLTISGTFSGSYTSGAYIDPMPSINVGSRGNKPIVCQTGVPAGTSFAGQTIPAGWNGVLTYDAVIFGGAWVCSNTSTSYSGVSGGMPISLAVAFCNKLKMDMWWNFPAYMTVADAITQATYIRDYLKPGLNVYFEWCNEVWNFSGTIAQQAQFHVQKGSHYGFGTANNANADASFGFWGLRIAQVFSGIGAIWSGGVGLHRVIATQAVVTPNTNLYIGTKLKSASTPYWSLVGIDYSVNGNRPVDYCEHLSIAPYFNGQQCRTFFPGSSQAADYPSRIAGLTTAADNFAAGGAGIASALAWLDNDIRQGTYEPVALGSVNSSGVFTTASGTCTTNHLFTNTLVQLTTSNTLPSQLALATQYKVTVTNDAAGTFTLTPLGSNGSPTSPITSLTGGSLLGISFGIADQGTLAATNQQALASINANAVTYGKTIVCYEGGQSSWYPTTSNCTNMGISTAYAQKILNLVVAYQQSSDLYQITLDQMNSFKAFSNASLPCQLQIIGENEWSLLQGFIAPVDGTPSSFNGDILCAQNQSFPACVTFNS